MKIPLLIPLLLHGTIHITFSYALQNGIQGWAGYGRTAASDGPPPRNSAWTRRDCCGTIFFHTALICRTCNAAEDTIRIPLNTIATTPKPLTTTTTTSAGEALRRSAAHLPGYGPTDVFYPLNWQGTWTLRREDISVGNTTETAVVTTYPVRFIPSVENGAVVADRSFNERQYWNAQGDKGSGSGSVVQSIQWTETNPNDLNVVFTNGMRRNVKITKRATERTETTVSSSEFQRILQDQSSSSSSMVLVPPQLSSRRTLTKWKMINDHEMEGIEIVYDMNVEREADMLRNGKLPPPQLLSKSRLKLSR